MLKFTVKELVVAFGVAGLVATRIERKMKAAKHNLSLNAASQMQKLERMLQTYCIHLDK